MSLQTAKLKLIYVVTQAEFGGAQRYIFDLATALKDEFEITVAAGAEDSQELLIKCQNAGIRTYTFKNLVRGINPRKDLAAISELTKFFAHEKPDIIHLNSSKTGILGALAACKFRISNFEFRILYTVHGWVFNEPLPWWRKKLYIWLERIACKLHNKIIVLSKYDFDIAVKNKICAVEKMIIIPHGIKSIDFLTRNEAKNKLTTSYKLQATSSIWVGTIANLYKTKGIEYLIDAAATLKKEGLEPQFIVIGDGPRRRNLEYRIKNLGLKNFFLAGSIPDAAKYLKAFDIFILPSVKEGMPYVILEAAQASLPIVATSVGAIPEMLENKKSGLLVPRASSQLLASALQNLTTNKELGNKLGQEALNQYQKNFSLDKMLTETVKLYK